MHRPKGRHIPFIFLDHFGPIDVKPGEAKGASARPHSGIEALTLQLDGISWHKESLGNVSSMRRCEVQCSGCAPADV